MVAATPDFMPFNGFSRPLISDLPLQPQAYEVAFVDTRATAYESKPARPKDVAGKPHPTGGGFVADTAKVDPTAYVGPNAMVLDRAKVLDNARIEDYAVVRGNAAVKDNARVSGHALVQGDAQVYGNGKVRDWATLQGRWKVYENGRLLERAYTWDRGELCGNATIKGNTQDFGGAMVRGHAIKDGDCSNGANVDHQVLMCWVWGTDQKYADGRPDSGQLACNYTFKRPSPIYALDTHGVAHGYLMGAPETVAVKDGPGAIDLNGKDQYVELRRDLADFIDTTIAVWVNWAGGAADQRILHFGDGGSKWAYLTPTDAAKGVLKFAITANGKGGEQTLLGPSALPVGTWTHVAVTLKGDTGTLYVDGKEAAKSDAMTLNPDMVLGPNTLAGNDCFWLGRGAEGGYFKGLLTDFRVYVLPQEASAVAALADQLKNRAAGVVAPTRDSTPPKVAAAGFLMKPTAVNGSAAVMSAPKATDDSNWVEYAFTCKSGGGHDSGWITSNRWTDAALAPGKTYAYAFKMRDKWGNETPESAPAEVTLAKGTNAPEPGAFEAGPAGISPSAIRMTAKRVGRANLHAEGARSVCDVVEYRFTRDDGRTSGWQSSPTWTDTGLAEGAKHSYTVQARDGWGNASKVSAAQAAVARDDTPPARYRIGEWQTLPYATLSNCVAMRAMSVTGADGCPKIEPDPVECFFHCASGNGPDSGWVEKPFWQTPSLPDGEYRYQFKMRDKSPQRNETPYSSAETVVVSLLTGYHDTPLPRLAALAEGALVSFKGKVTAVEADAYVVSADGATVKVMPRTVASAANPELNGRDVAVQGCLWKCNGEKRVVWAEVK